MARTRVPGSLGWSSIPIAVAPGTTLLRRVLDLVMADVDPFKARIVIRSDQATRRGEQALTRGEAAGSPG